MKVKSYTGRSLDKLYKTVKKELGAQAVIVSSRKKGASGISGLFTGGAYEVIAVADDTSADATVIKNSFSTEVWERFTKLQNEQFRVMEQAVREIRSDMRNMSASISSTRRAAEQVANQAQTTPAQPKKAQNPSTPPLPAYARGWDPRFVKKITDRMPKFFTDASSAQQTDTLKMLLRAEENFPIKQGSGPQTIVLAGPTGSGKTTTVAKLAARWSLSFGFNIGIITTDTFRVAAVDQIKEYATLLGVDLKVVYSAADARRAAQAFSDKDLIIVDTAGRCHYDQSSLRELRSVLDGLGPFKVLLTLPATSAKEQLPEMIRNYNVLKPNYLVVTKIDETATYDLLTVSGCETPCPVAFVTNGQRVPQDIMPATGDMLANMLLEE